MPNRKKTYTMNITLTEDPPPESCEEMEDWGMTIESSSLDPYEIAHLAMKAAQEALNGKKDVLAFAVTH